VSDLDRHRAATLVRRHLDGEVTLEDLYLELEGSDDPLVRATVSALLHEPNRKGFVAASEKRWRRDYWEPLQALLAELDRGPDGVAPSERPVPRVGRRHVFGWCLFAFWAFLAGAEHAWVIWRQIATAAEFPLASMLFRTFALVVLTMAGIAGVGAVRTRLRLYRERFTPERWGRVR
jgi:hypothetical protein